MSKPGWKLEEWPKGAGHRAGKFCVYRWLLKSEPLQGMLCSQLWRTKPFHFTVTHDERTNAGRLCKRLQGKGLLISAFARSCLPVSGPHPVGSTDMTRTACLLFGLWSVYQGRKITWICNYNTRWSVVPLSQRISGKYQRERNWDSALWSGFKLALKKGWVLRCSGIHLFFYIWRMLNIFDY